jgi:hypothetical protein
VGTGKTWADDLRLLVDGKPVWLAPKAPKTSLDLDHEFDAGSGIALTTLTDIQIANLATLGRVWGFLKYHHPYVTAGQRHWDYDLFRITPAILAATNRETANATLLQWITGLGVVTPCKPCAKLDESNLHLRPELNWLANEVLLGTALSKGLLSIHANRLAGKQFYVSLTNVGNPSFDHELSFGHRKLPDAGLQILGLYRFWNIIEYWFPYRDVLDEDWAGVLTQFIPRIALAANANDYQRELVALIAKAHDTHANLLGFAARIASHRELPASGDNPLHRRAGGRNRISKRRGGERDGPQSGRCDQRPR